MTPLPTTFTRSGWTFTQLARVGDVALFRKSKQGFGYPIVSFEVIKVQKREAWSMGDQTFPAKEGYPSDEQWGTAGWTCLNLEAANKKLKELTA